MLLHLSSLLIARARTHVVLSTFVKESLVTAVTATADEEVMTSRANGVWNDV